MTLTPIESLWFEPGTAADAARAVNRHAKPGAAWITAHGIERQWKAAQRAGRLPPISRPHDGQFKPEHQAMVIYVREAMGRAA